MPTEACAECRALTTAAAGTIGASCKAKALYATALEIKDQDTTELRASLARTRKAALNATKTLNAHIAEHGCKT